ncbi:MAG: YIP1 family protein [Candidatus Bipolaricaulota bacterium]|nr:YIP1 family protein [Candidatus Bipolaricaulota bacterium]MDW8030494.1 Yip1 family protein [Candidatus Bipolaricaulota bacterium]
MEEPQTQTQPMRLSFWEMLAGTFISPSDTLSRIAQQRPIGWAIGFTVVLNTFSCISSALFFKENTLELGTIACKEFSLTSLALDIAQNLLEFVVFVTLVHGIIRIFKEEGSYRGAFSALAFAMAPPMILLNFMSIWASFSAQPVWPFPFALKNLNSAQIFLLLFCLFILIWMITLGAMAIRAHYKITAMGSIVTYILARIADSLIFRAIERLFEFL